MMNSTDSSAVVKSNSLKYLAPLKTWMLASPLWMELSRASLDRWSKDRTNFDPGRANVCVLLPLSFAPYTVMVSFWGVRSSANSLGSNCAFGLTACGLDGAGAAAGEGHFDALIGGTSPAVQGASGRSRSGRRPRSRGC